MFSNMLSIGDFVSLQDGSKITLNFQYDYHNC